MTGTVEQQTSSGESQIVYLADRRKKMAICRECNRDSLEYQEIKTKRNSSIVICNECLKRQKEEAKRARDSKKSI